jgi:hypothetical protein
MSTPAIRAMIDPPPSALALLVAWVLADHAHRAAASDDLALVTLLLDGRVHLHGGSSFGSSTTRVVVAVRGLPPHRTGATTPRLASRTDAPRVVADAGPASSPA